MGKLRQRFTKQEKSWIMYDWANSVYATNIMAAIFPILYAELASDTGNVWFGYAVSVASLIVAVLAPILGAVGDIKGYKKRMLTAFMLIGVVFTAVMAFAGASWQWMLVGYILSRIGFSGSCIFYDSFLTDVTTEERMDKVSGWGYAAGYIGGSTIPFIISIVVLMLCKYNSFSQKFSILIVSVWWLVFSIPLLINVKQVHYIEAKTSSVAKTAFRNFKMTLKDVFTNKGLLLFMLAYFFYIDGVDTIISMATNFGSTLGLDRTGMILALVVTQVVAVPCSILFSHLSKRFGAVRMIATAICIYFCITIVGFTMGMMVEPSQQRFVEAFDAEIEKVELQFENEEDQRIWEEDIVANLRENGKKLVTQPLTVREDGSLTEREYAYFYLGEDDEGLFNTVLIRLECDSNSVTERRNAYAFSSRELSEQVYTAIEGIRTDEEFKAEILSEEYTESSLAAAEIAQGLFWALAFMVGTVQGGIQALSRSYYARLIPVERSNEFFGFFDIFGRFAAVVGPALYATCYGLTGRASYGILSLILLFFMGGLVLLLGRKRIAETENKVREQRRLKAAETEQQG
ncbi:MAG: MFS transporter [Clostridia bacterium]|nr:MFS transporter [Clostridia bacterium]